MTNQPTDATIGVCSMEQEYMNDTTQKLIAANHRLTAQLAVEQAKAKALEEFNKETLKVASFATIMLNQVQAALDDGLSPELSISAIEQLASFNLFLSKPRPQPVDASSLARIARCAQFPDALLNQNLNNPQAARRLVNHWLDNYNALTPNDIALAQALAGGA